MAFAEDRTADAAAWLRRAQQHLTLAKLLPPEQQMWADQCFHAQQAVEIALKGVFVSRRLVFRFTHNLAELCTELTKAGVTIPADVQHAVVLTGYAVHARYPGFAEEVTKEEGQRAIALAETVLAWATDIIGPG